MGKILVTGANGFVGTALCAELRARHIGCVGAVRTSAVAADMQVGDLNAVTDWSQALSGCDTVIHLAARVHVMRDRSANPLAAFRATNVDATVRLAQQALAAGVKRLVYVSSVKVNGEQTADKPFTPFDQPAPMDAYGQSKYEAETALSALAHATGLELVVVRPPLVYGPGVRANFFRLMQLVKLGMPLPLGAVDNRRSMVALDNLVDLLIACALHPAAAGWTFMVSDDHDVSITHLLRMLASAMGKRPLLLPVPGRIISGFATLLGKSAATDRLLGSLQVDIAHTKSVLGWQPVIGVEQGVQKTVRHFLARD